MGIKNLIKPPTTYQTIEGIYFDTGNLKGNLRSGVVEENGATYFLEALFTGTSANGKVIAQVFRGKDTVRARIPIHKTSWRWNDITRRREEYSWTNEVERNLYVPEHLRKDLRSVTVPRSKREHQLVMYPECSLNNSTKTEYILILPWGFSEERIQERFFGDITNRCRSVCTAPEWTNAIWRWMMDEGFITQLHSFGDYVGFRVKFDENRMRQFISNAIHAGSISFPATNADDELAA